MNAFIENLLIGRLNYRKRRGGPENTSKVKFIENIFILAYLFIYPLTVADIYIYLYIYNPLLREKK
jgi:hypothetical protein